VTTFREVSLPKFLINSLLRIGIINSAPHFDLHVLQLRQSRKCDVRI